MKMNGKFAVVSGQCSVNVRTKTLQITLFPSLRGKHDRSNLLQIKGDYFVVRSLLLAMTALNQGFSFRHSLSVALDHRLQLQC